MIAAKPSTRVLLNLLLFGRDRIKNIVKKVETFVAPSQSLAKHGCW